MRPDAGLRRLVLGSAVVAGGLGLVVVGRVLPLDGWPETLLMTALCLFAGLGFANTRRAYAQCQGFRMRPDGSVEVELAGGQRLPGRIAPGCTVLARVAWVRLCIPGLGSWGEPLCLSRQDREQWRRFQVICRHLTAC